MEIKLNEIESKKEQLEKEIKRQNLNLSEIEATLKRLKSDKLITQCNISKIDGAIQAYVESIRILKEPV
jgi:septal ring factor EnvC (AmiA/AmiB activator)